MFPELTEKDKDLVKQLREKLLDLNLDHVRNSDGFLFRWLKARDYDVDKAEALLRKSLKWRADNNIDSILGWKTPEIYEKMFPTKMCGYDKYGHPVYVVPSRFLDMNLFWELDRDEYLRFNFKRLEEVSLQLLKSPMSTKENPVSQIVLLHDMEGFNLRSIMNRQYINLVQESTKIFDENWPELLYKAQFFFCPVYFSVLFAMIKPFIPKRTQQKMFMYGSNKEKWLNELTEDIPIEVLPTKLGGTNVGFDNAFDGCGTKSLERKLSIRGEPEVDGFVEVIIPAGKKETYNYLIDKPNSSIEWCFKTEVYDIGFSFHYTKAQDNKSEEVTLIIPTQRVQSQVQKQKGSHICHDPGTYTLVFDNSFSKFRSKKLHLKVNIIEEDKESENIEFDRKLQN